MSPGGVGLSWLGGSSCVCGITPQRTGTRAGPPSYASAYGRGISFEETVLAVEEGGLKDILVHPNQRRYPGQVILVVAYRDYIFLVPSVEEEEHYFLKTAIPSRKATRDYLEMDDPDEKS